MRCQLESDPFSRKGYLFGFPHNLPRTDDGTLFICVSVDHSNVCLTNKPLYLHCIPIFGNNIRILKCIYERNGNTAAHPQLAYKYG